MVKTTRTTAKRKMRNQKLRKLACILSLIATCIFSSSSHARKIEFSAGFFSFSATNERNGTSKSISGLGAYRIAYLHSFWDRYELDVGYSLLATQTIGGDLSFGFDLGINYFLLSTAGNITAKSDRAILLLQEQWRPFLGVSFNQRNFQSTSVQYAGMGLKLGTEYQLTEEISLSGILRYIMLGGPNQSEASQIEILSGVMVQF
jgi:hypothetical protein